MLAARLTERIMEKGGDTVGLHDISVNAHKFVYGSTHKGEKPQEKGQRQQKKGDSQQQKDLAADPEYVPEVAEEDIDDDESDNDSEDAADAAEIAPTEEQISHPNSSSQVNLYFPVSYQLCYIVVCNLMSSAKFLQALQEKRADATVYPTAVQTISRANTGSTPADSQTPARPDDDNHLVEAHNTSGGHLTYQDSNSPIDNSEENSHALVRQREDYVANICSQQHALESTSRTKEKKRRGEHGITMGYEVMLLQKGTEELR